MPHKYDISICIPTYNRPDMVQRLLTNINKNVSISHEIIIIDASDNNLTEQLVSGISNITYIHTQKGLTHQRNIGIDQVSAPFTLMLDDDILLTPGSVDQLISALKNNPNYGALSAYIDNEYGKTTYKYRKIYKKIGVYESLTPGKWLYCGDFIQLSALQPFSGIHTTDFLPAGATLFRSDVIKHIRPNNQFGYMAEDKEWTLRISKQFKIGVCGDAHITHDHVGSVKNPFEINKQKVTSYYQILANENTFRKLTALCFFQLEIIRTLISQLYRFSWKRFQKAAGILSGNVINFNKFLFN